MSSVTFLLINETIFDLSNTISITVTFLSF